MKTTKLVTLGLVGLTTLVLGSQVVGAAAIQGDPISADTNGVVKFSTATDIKPVDPEGETPEVVVPDKDPGGGSNTDDADLQILFVPNLVFGEYEGTTFNGNVSYDPIVGNTYKAKQQVFTKQDGTKVTSPNFAQIANSSNIDNWNFTVEASVFTSDKGNAYDSMVINFNNIEAKNNTELTGGKLATVAGGASSIMLPPGTGAVNMGGFADGTTQSINSFIFKDTAEGAMDGVTLTVPRGLSISNNEVFTSNLTWTVQSTVD